MQIKSTIKEVLKSIIPSWGWNGLKDIVRKVRYFGFYHCCPLCGSHLGRLLPCGLKFPVLEEKNIIGGGYRLNVQCPICNATDRERLVYLYLLKRTDLFSKPVRLLHIAPENGLNRVFKKCSNIDYLTADLYADDVMVKMDITDIEYPENCFDVIICNHVLEHVLDDSKAMSELLRVVKPGGWAILQVPISLSIEKTYEDSSIKTAAEKELHFGQSDHVRIYGLDYLDRLKNAGFEVVPFKWWDDEAEFGGSGNSFRLLIDERLIFVKKPE